MRRGLLAEFETPEAMLRAIAELRSRGYRRLDAFTPYPVHGLDEALGLRRSPLNWIVLPFALAGAAGGYLVQWHNNAYDYPLNVGGRPGHAPPAFVPITFEMTVLAAALAGFVVMLVLTRLPELWSPIFDVPGFERATIDRFWIGIDARDPALISPLAERDLTDLGALAVAWAGKEHT
ncbi:hypothetical protein BE20_35995 [Sorangium cellulosum]|uniref:DUF3341 domain-containing protein n=1 Tax=Sorangium cellulosum TaxID=56 RepID=A0A150T0Q7_SORCE|nr:hypothetical protein BE18_08450 [Sorangium cellulosum]KYF98158.1 hypothetical protein BE20_35995 [Sorangium cellulosum]